MNINKIILKSLLFFLLGFWGQSVYAYALQIVYPKSPNIQIDAVSTFFIGSTTPGASVTINGKETKVFENGSFVEVVPLKDGFNRFTIESKNGTEKDIFTYIIKKDPKNTKVVPEPELIEFSQNEYLYASIVKNNTPLRAQPNENAQRITHLNTDTVLMIDAKKGDYYRVSLSPVKKAWVRCDSVVGYSTINSKMLATVTDVTMTEDKLYTYIKTPLSFAVTYKITETDTGLTLDLYNIKENPSDTKIFAPTETIKSLAINNVALENKSTYFVELNNKLWGYDVYYENNCLVLKIRKAPQIDSKMPLKNITIAIDPGHGGDEYGAVGPTGVKEKDINLDVSTKLKTVLEKAGVNVVMTRTSDCNMELYERIKLAKQSDALILLSIHANALADGADPYKKHGTAVFYYNKESFELAKTLKNTLVSELSTYDDGVSKYSLVLTRPTMPMSVLIEIAYMIHPEEYALLLDENFRQKAAESIKNGLENYLKNTVNN